MAVTQLGFGWALGLVLAAAGCASSSAPADGAGGNTGNIGKGGSGGSAGSGLGGAIGSGGGGTGGSGGLAGLGGGQNSGGGGSGGTGGGGNASVDGGMSGGGIGAMAGGSSGGGATGGAGGGATGGTGGNAAAVETIQVPASGSPVSFTTSLMQGGEYLLKATGSVSVGGQVQDAEFASAPGGTGAMDSVGGTDVGIDVGLQPFVPPMGGDQVKLGPGRIKWYGGFRADYTYYMVVTGAGKPLTLKLVSSGAASSGQIAVSLFLLAPTPPATDKPIPGPMPPAPAPPDIGTKVFGTVQVPAVKTIVTTAQAGESNAVYLLQASGGVRCGGGGLTLGDADYDDWGPTGAGANNDDGPCDFGVGVDEASMNTCAGLRAHWWGPYRNDHIYYMLYAGTGKPISFLYFDSGYGDNTATDTITVSVFPAP
jgi:hypothetical protein